MNIRPARSDDRDAIHCLNAGTLGYDHPPGKTGVSLDAVISSSHAWIFVAEAGDGVAGYIHMADYACTYSDPLINILALAVKNSMQGKGVGRALIKGAEDFARKNGYAGIRLVSGENRTGAHEFYAAMGYAMRKMQKNFVKYF